MKVSLARDFKEFAALLNRHSVRFLVVGGYAVGFHGHPRYTKDFDLWVESDDENVDKLLHALSDFGFGDVNLQSADFLEPGRVIQLGREPVRIDLLTSLKGIDEFSTAHMARLNVDVDGVPIPVIGLDDLMTAKAAAGRPQDLADIDSLGK